jgi:hypothetical protein
LRGPAVTLSRYFGVSDDGALIAIESRYRMNEG